MSSTRLDHASGLPRLDHALALLPLRGFLGITFVYAGMQKLSDPGYLHKGAPTYLGTQLRGFAQGTPGGFILDTFARPHLTLAGLGIALVEIAIGLLVGVGLFTRAAALAGLGLNLLLFLTASWKTYPYFLGSDIVFVFAWLPLVLAGSAGQPALEGVLARRSRGIRGSPGSRRPAPAGAGVALSTRRDLLGRAAGLTGGATLLLGGLAALTRGSYRPRTGTLASRPASSSSAAPAPPSQAGPAASALPPGAIRLGPANRLGADRSAVYRDPGDGSPDILIRHRNGTLTALSAVCTHAGCTVGYGSGQVVCPCHGATYDPQTGDVTGGPAPAPLAPKQVLEHGGDIYAIPS